VEVTEQQIARFLEKYCKDGKDWKDMEGDLRLITVHTIKDYQRLTKDTESYIPARKHNQ
jgi:hypothetical protein